MNSDNKPSNAGTINVGANAKGSDKNNNATANQQQHPLTAAMRSRWSNFSDTDLKNVKTQEDLSAAVQSKYGITGEQAATQVKEWAVGRQF